MKTAVIDTGNIRKRASLQAQNELPPIAMGGLRGVDRRRATRLVAPAGLIDVVLFHHRGTERTEKNPQRDIFPASAKSKPVGATGGQCLRDLPCRPSSYVPAATSAGYKSSMRPRKVLPPIAMGGLRGVDRRRARFQECRTSPTRVSKVEIRRGEPRLARTIPSVSSVVNKYVTTRLRGESLAQPKNCPVG